MTTGKIGWNSLPGPRSSTVLMPISEKRWSRGRGSGTGPTVSAWGVHHQITQGGEEAGAVLRAGCD